MTTDFQQKFLEEKAKRRRVQRTLTLWLIAAAGLITIYYYFFYKAAGVDTLSNLAALCLLVYVLLGFAVLRGFNLYIIFRTYIVTTFLAFLSEILYTGGLNSSVVPHLIYIPLLSLFYGKRIDLIAFFILTLLAVSSLYFYQWVFGYDIPNFIVDEERVLLFNLTNYLFILFAVLPLAFFFKYEIQKTNRSLKNSILKQQETYDQLLHSEKLASIGQLTAGVAHEVNNPANFLQMGSSELIKGFADLKEYTEMQEQWLDELLSNLEQQGANTSELRKRIKDERERLFVADLLQETASNLEVMKDGATRIVEIVKSLNTFSRKDEVFAARYSIHDGIESTLTLLKGEWFDRIEITKDFGEVPTIECNPGNINQVLLNVLSNAMQAIEGVGKITIQSTYEPAAKQVAVDIVDDGEGISPEHLKSIFDPFFTTKEVGKGTGLGLAISKRIIENHRGTIEVSSTLGAGTTFTITLPTAQAATGLETKSPEEISFS